MEILWVTLDPIRGNYFYMMDHDDMEHSGIRSIFLQTAADNGSENNEQFITRPQQGCIQLSMLSIPACSDHLDATDLQLLTSVRQLQDEQTECHHYKTEIVYVKAHYIL